MYIPWTSHGGQVVIRICLFGGDRGYRISLRLLTSEQASSGLSVKHAKRFSARVYNSRLSTRPETPPPFGHPVKMGHPYLENYHSEGNSNRERTNQDKQMDMEESAKSVLTLPSHQPLSLIFTHCLFPVALPLSQRVQRPCAVA